MPTATRRTRPLISLRAARWLNPGRTITRGCTISTPHKRTFLTAAEARDLAERLHRIADRLDDRNDFNPTPERL